MRGDAQQQHPGLLQPLPAMFHTRSPALFRRSASFRTRGLSWELWLRKTSNGNFALIRNTSAGPTLVERQG